MTDEKEKPTTAVELGAIVLAGINAERYLPDPKTLSAAEDERLHEGSRARNDGKEALRHLLVIVESFGWPEQLATETREEFVARRWEELDEVVARVERERARLVASDG